MGLSLIFNKQYRKERALISTLADKIGKSGQISVEYIGMLYKGNVECFLLDDIEIQFKLIEPRKLTVVKDGKDIYSMDCSFDQYDSWQQQRFNWFHDLLMYAREREQKLTEKVNKKRKVETATHQMKAATEAQKAKEQVELSKIQKALDRLK